MDENEKAGIRADVAKLALPVLVERLGGSVKITEAELNALTKRKVAVRADYIGGELFLALVDAPARPPVN
jgi:hypothetical protein